MNRLLVVALAAALSQFALGCTEDRTEIYQAPQQSDQTGSTSKIDKVQVSDSPDLAFPVPAAAETPIDKVAVKVVDDHIDLINGGIVDPSTILPPVYDPTRLEQVNADGTVTTYGDDSIDPNEISAIPGISVNPLLVIDAPPSKADAQTQPDGLPPF